jgi:drug/metabolite transporter (DMT)-like permease
MGRDHLLGDRALPHLPLAQVAVSERNAAHLDTSSNPLLGIALKVAATFAFTLMAAIARHLGDIIPVGQIVFFRSAFAFLPIAAFMTAGGHTIATLATKHPLLHARRALTGVLAMFTYFGALVYLPLADVTAISFASPLMVVALAAVLLGETVRLHRWSAVAIGFVGVVIMVSPHWGRASRKTRRRSASALQSPMRFWSRSR